MRFQQIFFMALAISLTACQPELQKTPARAAGHDAARFQKLAQDASPLQASISPREMLGKAASLLTTTMLQCPALIWPSYDWKNINVMLTAEGEGTLLWNGSQGGSVSEVAPNEVPARAVTGMYSFFENRGVRTLSLYVRKNDRYLISPTAVFRLGVHEGFHFLGQAGWSDKPGGQRSTLLPLEDKPRLYRRLMFRRLKEHVLSGAPDSASLHQAAFWFQKWKSEFPHEVNSVTDGYEGTAEYAETLAHLVGLNGCQISESGLQQKLIDFLRTSAETQEFMHTALDSEGYSMGSLAAYALRFNQKRGDWYARVKTGETPLEILFENVGFAEDVQDPALAAEYGHEFLKSSQEAEALIGEDLALVRSAQTIFVVPPASSNQGSKGYFGFYSVRDLPQIVFGPFSGPVLFQGPGWTLEVAAKKSDLTFEGEPPCRGRTFAMAPSSILIEGGTLQATGAGMVGAMPGDLKTDSTGRCWFCGQ